ncbi:MAG: ErfK/YbiS/YcfS/YnhG family protein [Bryobacterales bacterium]|nr:ErfK/YbiS/YcfS/YnhG family protein [Bryobacterales bacterium]
MRRYLTVLPVALGLISISTGQVKSKQQHTSKQQHKQSRIKAAPRIRYDLAAVNNPATTDQLDEKAEGSAALRAQILLARAHFSMGEIDGRMGTNALHAVQGFRAAHGLPPGTSVDADVWKALNMDEAPALVEYTLTGEDVEGPFVTVPAEMMLKAKLKYLGYGSALEGIAEKFHINPALLQQLNPGSKFSDADQKIYVPNVLTQVNQKATRVVVSKSESTVKAVNDMGQVIAQYPCTSGSEHDPLPIGEWKVTGVFKNPKFNYNPDLFWDAKPKDSKATIAPGPNNPVGVVWIDLSKEHYGIHGTPSPGQIGHTESHGCIRLTNWDALELAGMVDKGTPVSLTE